VIARRAPLIALGAAAAVDLWYLPALALLAPELSASLGLTAGAIVAIVVVHLAATAVAALPVAAMVERHGGRGIAALVALFAWCAATAATAFAASGTVLAVAAGAAGAAGAAARTLHPPLAVDSRPTSPARAIAAHRATQFGGAALAPVLLLAAAEFDLSWRGALVGLGALGILTAVAGGWARDARPPARHPEEPAPSTVETAHALTRSPGVSALLGAYAAVGACLVPLLLAFGNFLEDQSGIGAGGQAALAVAAGLSAALALALLAPEAERVLARSPARLSAIGSRLVVLAAMALAAFALVPWTPATPVLLCAAAACLTLSEAAMVTVLMTIVPRRARAHAASLAVTALAGGAIGGVIFLGGLSEDIGPGAAMAGLAVPLAGTAVALRRAADVIDHRGVLPQVQAVASAPAAGAPLLACDGIVVHFGNRRALDGVDLAVAEGELVGLVGTNGAGKSTLLRVMAGLVAPDQGTVRIGGWDLTAISADRRARRGVAHVAGSASVFDPLAVRESLGLAAYAAGLAAPAAAEAVASALASFPALAARASAPAATLSGGERQMLALAQALVRRPRILLVDELSQGLAPAAREELLEVVRRLHESGTTMVVVEQSIDLALSLAPRMVFLERGRVRFDGPSPELAARSDLLRPVYLGGPSR
jgi:ABC-type branched-subunit amino acid transport system ATPase component